MRTGFMVPQLLLVQLIALLCAAQSEHELITATFCQLATEPQEYNGKMVKVRGSYMGIGSEEPWLDNFNEPKGCPAYIPVLLSFPEDVKPKPDFEFSGDESYEKFRKTQGPMTVEATFEGRFEAVITSADRTIKKGEGYGKKRDYAARLVIRRISDVVARPIPRR